MAETLLSLVLSILVIESADSIRSLYRLFSGITRKSLNAFNFAYSYTKAGYLRFMNSTTSLAFKLVHSQSSCVLTIPWSPSLVTYLNLYQNFSTMLPIMVQII